MLGNLFGSLTPIPNPAMLQLDSRKTIRLSLEMGGHIMS